MTRRDSGIVRIAFATIIIAAMATFLSSHGGQMWRAAMLLDPWGITTTCALCLAHRVINAAGWGLVLGALGEPVRAMPSARVWLASEACRWIPGSVWAFGSRAFLASARGIPVRVASASVVLELVLTVIAWAAVAMLGAASLPLTEVFRTVAPSEWVRASCNTVIYGITILGIVILVIAVSSRLTFSKKMVARVRGLRESLCIAPHGGRLVGTILFFVAMAVFNGLILLVLVRSLAAGREIPMTTVIAGNAVAWLAGFLAILAPGGLVVREACLAGLFSIWIPTEQAIAVALAWRLLQVIAEIVTFGAVVAGGLPNDTLRRVSVDLVGVGASVNDLHPSEMKIRCGSNASILGVA